MPLTRCRDDDRPGWKWGDAGRCYLYTPGDEASEREARRKALAQAVAMGEIETRQGQGNITTPDAGDLNTEARRYAASRGWAMSDGSYPIRPADVHGGADLDKAIRAVGRGGGSHDAIRRHIIKRARAIGMSDRIPENWSAGGEMRSADLAHPAELEIPHGQVEFRESVLAGVDFKQRIIDLIVVPYEEEGGPVEFRGELWGEIFSRSAFEGIENHAGRVGVRRGHLGGDTVGKMVQFLPSNTEGLIGRGRIAPTPKGDETLILAEEDCLSPSVGFTVRGRDQVLDRRTMLRRINRAFVDHVAMVEQPAYEGAKVLAVREGLSARPAATEPLRTPVLDEFLSDDIISWANSRRTRQ